MLTQCRKFFCLSATLSLIPSLLFATERELLVFMDIPTVVTASKMAQPITEAPATIDVITDRQIEDYGCETLGDALRLVPGIDALQMISQMFVTPRGLAGRRSNASVLCLIDGHPYNESTRGAFEPQGISLVNVKRIEVIKGPGSALYGANAFAGVINIITKSAGDVKGVELKAGPGSYGTQKLSALYGGSGSFDRTFSFWRSKTDHFAGGSFDANDDRDDINVSGKASKGGFTAFAEVYRGESGIPGSTRVPSPASRGRMDQWFVTADYTAPLSDSFELKTLNHVIRTWQKIDDTQTGTIEGTALRLGSELQANWHLSAQHALVAGAELKRESNDSVSMCGSQSITTSASYLQDEWRPADCFIVTAGLRYDMPSAYRNVLSPRLNLLYKHSEQTTFKASYGEAFRAPNFFELYADARVNFLYRLQGNEDLLPERIQTMEISLSHLFSRAASLNVNAFGTKTFDTIAFSPARIDPSGRALTVLTYENQSGTEIVGGEATFKYAFSPAVSTALTYSLQHARDIATGKQADLAPNNKAGMTLDLQPMEKLRLGTFAYYTDCRSNSWGAVRDAQIKPSVIVNLKGAYSLSREFSLSAAVYNLFDTDHEELSYIPLSGRSFLVELGYRFGA